jgi:hypothetical protein
VLGNIIHSVFQQILETMDFKLETLKQITQNAIKCQLLLLYFLKKTVQKVEEDVSRAVKNITGWLNMMFQPSSNAHNMKYQKFIAAE